MIDVPIILAEHVHHETQISNVVDWYNICAAYPDINVLNFLSC